MSRSSYHFWVQLVFQVILVEQELHFSNMSETGFTPQHLKEIYNFAVQLAKDAGRMLMDGVEIRCGNDNTPGVEQEQVEKDSSVDIVTQTDEGMPYSSLVGHCPCVNLSQPNIQET